MGFFDRFRRKQEPQVKLVRGYAAAQQSRLLEDFIPSARSADAELRGALKPMRERSRDLGRNNEYAKRYFNLMKTNIVGDRGFTLQVKARNTNGTVLDQEGNQAVESAFRMWGSMGHCTVDGRMTWLDAQRLAVESLARDGEVFIVKHRGASFHDSFALEFIEPDQVDEAKNERLANGNQIRMGVEFDRFRKPVAYHVLVNHPGDSDYTMEITKSKHIRVPADRMIHIFLPLRAGQTRGEPWLAPVMFSLKQLSGFREAAVINARIGASKMGFFTSPTGDGFLPDDLDGQAPIMDCSPGTMHQLPNGMDFKTFDPQYPSNEFDSFNKSVLKGIASGLGVSYTSLANDLEATSYSSIRQGALEERDQYRVLQCFMKEHFVMPVYRAWLESAMELNSFGIPVMQFAKFYAASEFRARAWSWVDPQKEMNAAVLGMQNGILSLQDVASQYGKDVEELLAQIARDRELMAQFDVQYDLEPYASTRNESGDEEIEEEDASERQLNDILAQSLQRVFND